MAIYQLNKLSIDTIIDYCNDLNANEKLALCRELERINSYEKFSTLYQDETMIS